MGTAPARNYSAVPKLATSAVPKSATAKAVTGQPTLKKVGASAGIGTTAAAGGTGTTGTGTGTATAADGGAAAPAAVAATPQGGGPYNTVRNASGGINYNATYGRGALATMMRNAARNKNQGFHQTSSHGGRW